MSEEILLTVNHLVTSFDTEDGRIRAVDDVSFAVKKGKTLGIVGESGCGKSVTALSIMRLLPKPSGMIEGGQILFGDTDIVRVNADQMHKIRGNHIAMIFQEPMTALNPVHKIGRQISEVFHLHYAHMNEDEIRKSAAAMLRKVGIPDPEQRFEEYPHQISGGMRQRVMIAMALACQPDILIADEPTTALDVTIQAQILDLIKQLQHEIGMAVIFITHDLGVIAEICDDVVVMYAGKVAESAPIKELFQHPVHPYTRGLLSSIPRLETPRKSKLNIIKGMVPSLNELPSGCRFQNRCPHAEEICKTPPPIKAVGKNHFASCWMLDTGCWIPDAGCEIRVRNARYHTSRNQKPAVSNQQPTANSQQPPPLLEVNGLKMYFPVHGGIFWRKIGSVYAVDDVSFTIRAGETLGLVGESGCGKTTAGRTILRLYEPTAGEVIFDGNCMSKLRRRELRDLRRHMQMIFQDPFESLNSRHTIGDILEEPFIIHNIGTPQERQAKVKKLLELVGISKHAINRFPHEFSGGQRQRIGIARAIALEPKLIICDEPVSALDVSIQSQILNLLLELQQEMNLTYLFIAHDLAVVKHISDAIAVMYLGKIVEYADADTLYENPSHPYTKALISAIPVPDPCAKKQRQILTGDVPSPVHPPSGCRFHTRCPIMIERCKIDEPVLASVAEPEKHLVACHRKPHTVDSA